MRDSCGTWEKSLTLLEGTVENFCTDTSATSSYLNRRLRDLAEAEREILGARSVLQDFRDTISPDVKVKISPDGDR